jgi:hypothetical protein
VRAVPVTIDSTNDHGLEWAQCRSMGHEWKHQGRITDETDPGHQPPVGMQYGSAGFRSVCTECGTERVRWISRSGLLGPMRYNHPDGYSRTGDAKLTGQEWRKTWLVKLLGEDDTVPAVTIRRGKGRRQAATA